MPKRTSPAKAPPVRVVIVTLDQHLAGAVHRAEGRLQKAMPGLTLRHHAAADWDQDDLAFERCRSDCESADIIVATMLFMDAHVQRILPVLAAQRDRCDALVGCLAAPEITKLTRCGGLEMDGKESPALALLKRFKPKSTGGASAGAQQMSLLRRLPQILKYIPGKAQDLRAYFLTLSYWLAGSESNVEQMVRMLVDRYASGPRAVLRGTVPAEAPVIYPDVGLYHPDLPGGFSEDPKALPPGEGPRVGVLLMRSYLLAGNTAHYDGVIRALEARGLCPVPIFASGLDARPAIDRFFLESDAPPIEVLLSLTGFSLVGGPAYNDSDAAEAVLKRLDVPYLAAHALEFQPIDQWQGSAQGLAPVEATIMVSIPELDGATAPTVFGGRPQGGDGETDMQPIEERVTRLADRVAALAALRRTAKAERRVGVVLFNFPPQGGAVGTAAHLSVWRSLAHTLASMKRAGYTVEAPEDPDALRRAVLQGNAARYGTEANVLATIPVDRYVEEEPHLEALEAAWGPAPGQHLTNGAELFVLGANFGNVSVLIQPGFGYEGDPMRLLFEGSFAPTHAFSAFYRYLREEMAAHAVLHFGTHGALEFMPGKQVGLSGACWPERLLGALPNFYLYAANNPSEGALAKRRGAATLISYLTPTLARAGLHGALSSLREQVDGWRQALAQGQRDDTPERNLARLQAEAAALDLCDAEPPWVRDAAEDALQDLQRRLLELEDTLIPEGLHVVGEPLGEAGQGELLEAVNLSLGEAALPEAALEALLRHRRIPALKEAQQESWKALQRMRTLLSEDHELPALLAALDGRFIAPAPGGDLLRNPEVLPAGRNIHGFDPFRLPSAAAVAAGWRQAEQLLAHHQQATGVLPECVALVLWGTDTLKTEGGPLGQALALLGAVPRFDSYGRLAGATLMPLEQLGRPRIDVIMTLSGIFRDLLPLQTKLLAEAACLAALAPEADEDNFLRKHARAYAAETGCSLEDAALRVFSNAEGAYGSNVNQMLESGAWESEGELASTYKNRKGFAYSATGLASAQPELLSAILGKVDLAYQNLESLELGVTTIDHYFDTLGGISLAAGTAQGEAVPVYIGDQTRGTEQIRTLKEQVALESHTRLLNPKWFEGLLSHGYEGVRQIESHVTNTLGWSATTGAVDKWVYDQLSETYVLNDALRERMAALNPGAALRLADRLLEANERSYWEADEATLEALQAAREALEDRLEGLDGDGAAAA